MKLRKKCISEIQAEPCMQQIYRSKTEAPFNCQGQKEIVHASGESLHYENVVYDQKGFFVRNRNAASRAFSVAAVTVTYGRKIIAAKIAYCGRKKPYGSKL